MLNQIITRFGILILLLLFCALSMSAFADGGKPAYEGAAAVGSSIIDKWDRFPKLVVPSLPAPKIDGIIDDREWEGASRFVALEGYEDSLVAREHSTFWLCHDKDSVYIAARLERPSGVAPKVSANGPVDALWNKDDGVEFCFSPDKDRKAVFSLHGNSNNGYSRGFAFGKMFDTSIGAGVQVDYRSRYIGNAIEIEIRLPAKSFDDIAAKQGLSIEPLHAGNSWGFTPMRSDLLPNKKLADWSHMWDGGMYYSGRMLGRLAFADDATGVSVARMGSLGGDAVGAEGFIVNGGEKSAKYTLEYTICQAPEDLRSIHFSLFNAWDIVERFRKTDAAMLEGLSSADQIGEKGWLGKIGQALKPVKNGEEEITVSAGARKPFRFAYIKPSGQFLVAYKIKDAAGNVLASDTKVLEVKSGIDMKLDRRFLTRDGVYITADASAAQGVKPGDFLRTILKDGRGKTVSTLNAKIADPARPLDQFVSMKGLPVGDYQITAEVISTVGKRLAADKVEFRKPETPSWWKNNIGYTDKVPWPWTPVQASAGKAAVWGRNIAFTQGNPMPSSITSQGVELLSSPIQLTGTAGGAAVKWNAEAFALKSSTPRRAVYQGVYTSGNLRLNVETILDYDGLVTFKATPEGKGTLENLKLQIPVRPEVAGYWGTSLTGTRLNTAQFQYKAGKISDFAKTFPGGDTTFNGLFFLGNGDVGLEWICEEDRYWSNADYSRQMRLDATPGAVTLTVNFIDKPVELSAKRTLVWSLMPAPVKDISWYYKYDLNTANGIDGWTPKGAEYINEKVLLDGIKRHKEGGITHYLVGGGGPPFHADVWMRGYNTNGFQQLTDTIHNSGMKFVQYNCFVYHNNGEESKDFGSEMVKHPLAPYYEDTYWYNPEGPFVDFWIAGLKWNMHKYGTDGTYLDGMPTTGIHCDPFMDQGYIDAKGDPHGKWPIYALRGWAERMYTMMHETERKDGIVYQHDSGMIPNLAIVSFADIRCGGEEAPSKERLLASWPLDEYLVKYDERMYGIPVHTLWYNWWKKPIKENQVLAVTLLFGQTINRTGVAVLKWNINSADYEKETTPHIALLRLLKGFDVYSATWIPFWRSSGYVTLNPSTLKASMYLHPGKKALVIVSNLETQPAVNSTVMLNLKQMGFSGAVRARDAFLGTEFKVEGQTIKVDVQEERYRLLLIEAVDRVSP